MSITPKGEDGAADCEALIRDLDGYFRDFAVPLIDDDEHQSCHNCGVRLNGLLGQFTWGIVNGEGTCANCGWPCRAYHRPKDEDGELIFNRTFEMILQYHPEDVTAGANQE